MFIYISDELSHHGVKGMRWGIRKQRVSSGTSRRSGSNGVSSGRKKMSTAKKVAIGAACVAAVAGISYVAITRGNNKSAMAGKKYAMRVMRKYSSDKIKRGSTKKLTGHSGRVTQLGAARHRGNFYTERARKMPLEYDYMTNPNNARRITERKANEAWDQVTTIARRKPIVRFNTTRPMNRLKRQRGPSVLRYK